VDPWLSLLLDQLGRRLGAPAELVALTHPGGSGTVVETTELAWLGHILPSHLSLVGQVGAIAVVRGESAVTTTTATVGGQVVVCFGPPGRLAEVPSLEADADTVALMWRLLDPLATRLSGPISGMSAEVLGRAIIERLCEQAIVADSVDRLTQAVTAFVHGSLPGLGDAARIDLPSGPLTDGDVLAAMALLGYSHLPARTDNLADTIAVLHRRLFKRWQIARDLTEVFGLSDLAHALLWGNSNWQSAAAS